MKKFLVSILATLFIAPVAFGQLAPLTMGAGSDVKVMKLHWATEGDYISNIAGTADDTSSTYATPHWGEYTEMWLWAKGVGQTGVDSLDEGISVWVRSYDLDPTGALGQGWILVQDTISLTTADTIAGDYCKVNLPPYSHWRVIVNGETKNDSAVTTEVWALFKGPRN